MTKMDQNFHVGKLIRQYLTVHKMKAVELSRLLQKTRMVGRMHTTKQSMQTSTLLEICHALRYNFFQDIANTLPDEFKINERPNLEKAAQEQERNALIAQLQEENKVLKIQNELLMKMNGMS